MEYYRPVERVVQVRINSNLAIKEDYCECKDNSQTLRVLLTISCIPMNCSIKKELLE